jgi:6-phosphogluconate dehydrogenase
LDEQPERVRAFLAGPGQNKRVAGAVDWNDFVNRLERPRRVFVMVPAGKPVDAVLDRLLALLEPGDIVVECGNSQARDTARRAADARAKGIAFVGMGVSGGERGALDGPCLMPGGEESAWRSLSSLLERCAAQTADGACAAWMGPGGAGHYVKMVHNGIEYAEMQLLAEAYDLLRRVGGLTNLEMADTFEAWNKTKLAGYLVEITGRIFHQRDGNTGRMLVDNIKDSAGMKGTGQWTVQEGLVRAVPIPTIAAAVDARGLSAQFALRQVASRQLAAAALGSHGMTKVQWIATVGDALYCAKSAIYAQGFALLKTASDQEEWALPLAEIARIWQGGCIIRAQLLQPIRQAFQRDPALGQLLLDPFFKDILYKGVEAWRHAVSVGVRAGVPLPALGSSLCYFDSLRAVRLPANLIQAQRDLFGAHTYERLDQPGSFHTQWD